MINHASRPLIWDPDTEGVTAKLLATSAREIGSLKLSTTGAGPATIYLYDSNAAVAQDLRWVMDAPATGPDFNNFSNPLNFYKGIYAVMVQGAGLKAILNYTIVPAPANSNPNQ